MIRDLKQKDIDKVMEIWLESTIKAHDFIPEKYWQDNYNAVKDIYIPQSKTYVYEEGEEIKGFISILNDDFIGALFVSPNEQGKGIGSKLIEYANAKFNNLKLAVYKQNQKSVDFYMIDCQYKCNILCLCCSEDLCRCFISKTLARSIIYYIYYNIKLILSYSRKIKSFRIKLS